MPKTLRYNNTIPSNIYYSNTKVKKVFYNNTLVWSSNVIEGTLAVGNVITFDDRKWRVIHNKNNLWYLALEYWEENTIYDDNEIPLAYNRSSRNKLRIKCASYYDTFSNEAKQYIQLSTGYGYDDDRYINQGNDPGSALRLYVWVPQKNQMEYEFYTYFGSDSGSYSAQRKYYDINGGIHDWWLGTSYKESDSGLGFYVISRISTIGQITENSDATNGGFRPFICIKV